uniref:Erythromycin biosynthesis protein CIII-like C-terminal domain-containing protein n=1 Tax=Alexandrium catenella TaxID=2925 RepID=A0A7S1S6L5_ALECA|mmetsp:Transcript_88409/g.234800  ORF Transcript_88409/g.234800 Transcript_88409/m.234800 type:complete len:652 (+) Transcript_88409:98-2053(+)
MAESYKFAFGVNGTRGDFQPYLGLGQYLLSLGHQVRFYSTVDHCQTAKDFGLDSFVIGADMEDVLASDVGKRSMEEGDFLLMVADSTPVNVDVDGVPPETLRENAKKDLDVWKPHMYITNQMGHVSEFNEAMDRFDFVWATIQLQPQSGPPSNTFRHVGWSREFPEPDVPLICTHIFGAQSIARMAHEAMQKLVEGGRPAEEVVDTKLGPESIFRLTFEMEKRVNPAILAYSPNVFPSPDDWSSVMDAPGSRVHVVGRLGFTREQQDELSKKGNEFFSSGTGESHQECQAFLAKGPPPVYIGWGSMSVYTSEHMTFLAVEALKLAGQRGIILSGWAKLSADDLDCDRPGAAECREYAKENILFMKKAPHEWLFPQCCLCVHHGGIGTMQASLGAGTPTIITPVFADQEGNAAALTKGGWGVGTTKLGKLKSEELGEAVRKVCTDPSFKERTEELYKKMQAEDGIAKTTEIMLKMIKEELLTGEYKRKKEAERVELRALRTKQVKQPINIIFAKWNAELNKRYPPWAEYNKRSMGFAINCVPLVEAGRLWCVSASSCLVREGQKLESAETGRFKKYCFLEEVEKKGSRLRVKKVKGFGPDEGWVSPSVSGKAMLEHITDATRIGAIQGAMYSELFADFNASTTGQSKKAEEK